MKKNLFLAAASLLVVLLLATALSYAFQGNSPVIARSYAGVINNKLKVKMDLQIWQDGFVSGYYFYTKNGIGIPVEGKPGNTSRVELVEKAPTVGNRPKNKDGITGYFRGSFHDDYRNFSGTWSSYNGAKSFPFKLTLTKPDNDASRQLDTPAAKAIFSLPVSVEQKRKMLESIKTDETEAGEDERPSESSDVTVQYKSPHLLSLLQHYHYQGATHDNSGYSVKNYWIRNAHAYEIKLDDLFKKGSGYRKRLTDLCVAELKKQNATSIVASELYEKMAEFTITRDGLVFYFAPYDVGPYAEGEHITAIPYRKLVSIINSDGPLAEFVKK